MTDLLIRPPTEAKPGRGAAQSDVEPPPTAFSGSTAGTLVLVVAPSTGRFRPCGPASRASAGRGADELVPAGTLLGHTTGGRGRADAARAPLDLRLHGLLVRSGQLVQRGQPLAWGERAEPAGQTDAVEGGERAA